ncbi:hypothetical protein BS50DRAFT_651064 [Corynespora cassiicola Philippines]|uniref:Uncharacterized protein n=1 Tax=Corynespora cassiicola Philippines TaxID=1448308 RepID=A0A2T2N8X3_CORCC|nr:hypothetical protein BS50DRAFT_651064 [Corynespora cassiicola Philippines]
MINLLSPGAQELEKIISKLSELNKDTSKYAKALPPVEQIPVLPYKHTLGQFRTPPVPNRIQLSVPKKAGHSIIKLYAYLTPHASKTANIDIVEEEIIGEGEPMRKFLQKGKTVDYDLFFPFSVTSQGKEQSELMVALIRYYFVASGHLTAESIEEHGSTAFYKRLYSAVRKVHTASKNKSFKRLKATPDDLVAKEPAPLLAPEMQPEGNTTILNPIQLPPGRVDTQWLDSAGGRYWSSTPMSFQQPISPTPNINLAGGMVGTLPESPSAVSGFYLAFDMRGHDEAEYKTAYQVCKKAEELEDMKLALLAQQGLENELVQIEKEEEQAILFMENISGVVIYKAMKELKEQEKRGRLAQG